MNREVCVHFKPINQYCDECMSVRLAAKHNKPIYTQADMDAVTAELRSDLAAAREENLWLEDYADKKETDCDNERIRAEAAETKNAELIEVINKYRIAFANLNNNDDRSLRDKYQEEIIIAYYALCDVVENYS